MKNRILRLIMTCIFVLNSCSTVKYNKVYSYYDEFRDNSKKFVRVGIKSEEKRSEVGTARIIMEKEAMKEGEEVRAYFVIWRSSASFAADGSGFIKVGGMKYELSLQDQVSKFRTKSEANITNFAAPDSTGLSSAFSTDIDTRTWIEDKFVITLPDEVVKAISGTSEAIFRFYFGPVPASYILDRRRLKLVKEVIGD